MATREPLPNKFVAYCEKCVENFVLYRKLLIKDIILECPNCCDHLHVEVFGADPIQLSIGGNTREKLV